jgi:hypothetical protein
MSKLYQLNRMTYGAAAGDPWLGGLLKVAGKAIGGIFKKKGVQAVVQTAGRVARSPVGQAAIYTGAGMAASSLLQGGGGGRGAAGGWGAPRRAKGITARELRGYRKVANLLHREGMVSRRARGRK